MTENAHVATVLEDLFAVSNGFGVDGVAPVADIAEKDEACSR